MSSKNVNKSVNHKQDEETLRKQEDQRKERERLRQEKINDAFLKDSLQYEQTKLLKQSNKEILEIDTAMNNPNSKDPAIPVFDD